MPRALLAFCALALAGISGCATPNAHSHGGALVADYRPDDHVTTITAPYKATYALYQWNAPPADQPPPQTWIAEDHTTLLFVRGLERSDAIGFEKGTDGKILAVAGTEKIALEPGRYCWHVTEATELRGLPLAIHELGDAVTEIIALPFGIIFLILVLPFLPLLIWLVFCHV